MHSSCRYRMHFRLGNMTSDHWYSVLPNEQFLVVRAAHEFVLLDEGKGVDCTEMLGVFHGLLAGSEVELEDFLGVCAAEEHVGVMLGRMELQSQGDSFEAEGCADCIMDILPLPYSVSQWSTLPSKPPLMKCFPS